MGIKDKAKVLGTKVNETVTYSSDAVIAKTIIRAVEKQESVNVKLKEKGCDYRIADIELSMGVPPTVTFAIRKIPEIN